MGIYEEVTATFLSGKCKWNLFYRSFSFIVAPGPHALIVAFVSILLVTMTVRLTMSPSVLSSALHCQNFFAAIAAQHFQCIISCSWWIMRVDAH
jgi:hypothetical protein